MFKLFKSLELPPQLHWKLSDEPALMEWAIRARNYNTFVANCMFGFLALVLVGVTYALYPFSPSPEDFLSNILISTAFYAILISVVLSMTHQKMNYAYRFTAAGLEYCEWKDFPKWALPALKWIAGVTAVILLFMATIDPNFLIGALAGPGGMGLMYLKMAYSKSFRDFHTEYHHHFLDWTYLTLVTIANNRHMIEFSYNAPKPDSNRRSIGRQYVFFQKAEKQRVIDLIKWHLPESTLCKIGHVNVLN
jgi:hypothetical protein